MSAPLEALRRKVGNQVADAMASISKLREQLDAAREENRALLADRDRLERALVRIDVLELERTEAESRVHEARLERKRLEEALTDVEDERDSLAARCEDLEALAQRERAALDEARLEIGCLEEQIDELRSIVKLLSGDGGE